MGATRYIVALHTADTEEAISDSFVLGGDADCVLYNWRSEEVSVGGRIELTLARRDWALIVVCPIREREGTREAMIGDTSKYVTMGYSTLDGLRDLVRVRKWTEGVGLHEELN